jgi:lipoprotein NlpD
MLLALVLSTLAGCASDRPKPPIEERAAPPSRRLASHVVHPGETLFSIAWSHGVDFRQLAATNRIEPPYLIKAGQVLRLPGAGGIASDAAVERTGESTGAGAAPGGAASGRSAHAAARRSATVPQSAAADANRALPGGWRWPASGVLLAGYRVHSPAHKGIDIRGELGEPVYAANDGKVVYAGSGLVGYGNLLIIKHSDRYLSAYAHNNRLLVGEGAQVKAGDRIAEIGDSGADTTKLHFEIRCDGEPVDPIRILPTR